MRTLLNLAPAAGLALGLLLPAARQGPEPGVGSAVAWLKTQQQADGGFSNGFTPESDPSATADAVLAILSAGEDAQAWRAGDATPISFLADVLEEGGAAGPGQAAKLWMAAQAAGLGSGEAWADLPAAILQGYDAGTGLFGAGSFDSGLALLALAADGEPLPQGAVEGLLAARLDDGSYAFSGETTPGAGDSNTTALAQQALLAAGRQDEILPSLDYLRAAQNDDGGWTYQKPSSFGEETDANSTALVIQALHAAGENLPDWGSPETALLSLQQPSGAFAFNASTPGDNLLATLQAIPALAGFDYTDIPALEARSKAAALHGAGGGALAPGSLVAVVLLLLVGVLVVGAWAGRRQAP